MVSAKISATGGDEQLAMCAPHALPPSPSPPACYLATTRAPAGGTVCSSRPVLTQDPISSRHFPQLKTRPGDPHFRALRERWRPKADCNEAAVQGILHQAHREWLHSIYVDDEILPESLHRRTDNLLVKISDGDRVLLPRRSSSPGGSAES